MESATKTQITKSLYPGRWIILRPISRLVPTQPSMCKVCAKLSVSYKGCWKLAFLIDVPSPNIKSRMLLVHIFPHFTSIKPS